MKTALYSTTALAAASLLTMGAGDAFAASHTGMKKAEKIKISVGGYFVSAVGFSDNDSDYENSATGNAANPTIAATATNFRSFNMYNDSEIYFRGNTRLDNGIRVDVIVQLEADQRTANSSRDAPSSDATIDESYLKFTGGFGDLRVGTTKSANFVLKHIAPQEGLFPIGNPRTKDFVVRPAALGDFGPGNANQDVGASDQMKIVYFTPRFEGFGMGFSYSNQGINSDVVPGGDVNNAGSGSDGSLFDATLTFERKLGDVNVQADLGWLRNFSDQAPGGNSNDFTSVAGGVVLSFAGWSVGGRYSDRDYSANDKAGDGTDLDESGYQVGIRYRSGPWGVSLAYQTAEKESTIADTDDQEITTWQVGARYNIGPGISLRGTLLNIDYEDETTAAGNNNEGWAGIAGVRVSF
jgi:outer membrane protein OmpU